MSFGRCRGGYFGGSGIRLGFLFLIVVVVGAMVTASRKLSPATTILFLGRLFLVFKRTAPPHIQFPHQGSQIFAAESTESGLRIVIIIVILRGFFLWRRRRRRGWWWKVLLVILFVVKEGVPGKGSMNIPFNGFLNVLKGIGSHRQGHAGLALVGPFRGQMIEGILVVLFALLQQFLVDPIGAAAGPQFLVDAAQEGPDFVAHGVRQALAQTVQDELVPAFVGGVPRIHHGRPFFLAAFGALGIVLHFSDSFGGGDLSIVRVVGWDQTTIGVHVGDKAKAVDLAVARSDRAHLVVVGVRHVAIAIVVVVVVVVVDM